MPLRTASLGCCKIQGDYWHRLSSGSRSEIGDDNSRVIPSSSKDLTSFDNQIGIRSCNIGVIGMGLGHIRH